MNMLILIIGYYTVTEIVDCLLPARLWKCGVFLTSAIIAYNFSATDILCKHLSLFPNEMPSLSHPNDNCVFYYLGNSHLQWGYSFILQQTGWNWHVTVFQKVRKYSVITTSMFALCKGEKRIKRIGGGKRRRVRRRKKRSEKRKKRRRRKE